MPEHQEKSASNELRFSFFKGSEDVIAPADATPFEWERAAAKVREHLSDAMNARHVAFLFGSGCSSFEKGGQQVGIPTMAPMAAAFLDRVGKSGDKCYTTETERELLKSVLGLDITAKEYKGNLERLMEVLYSVQFILKRSTNETLKGVSGVVDSVVKKITGYISKSCLEGAFSQGDDSVINIYQAFYRKLIYRDRALPRPWVFTTNYDLFNETAMDRLAMPYSNGFSGSVERRFNPASFRYALAEQLDLSSRKWTSVDSYVYLCKLHGSINWIEEGKGLFPLREVPVPVDDDTARVLIYPTPMKHNASLGSPYSDLFREFQGRIVREQSVLFAVGYSFSDEHINNIIFQALTIPTFRLVAFLPRLLVGVPSRLKTLGDPRIWIIGGKGPIAGRKAHYFDTFVEKFMPEPPGETVDTAIEKVLHDLMVRGHKTVEKGEGNDV